MCLQGSAPVERGVPLERVDAHMLLHQAVQENRQGSETDVVQRQVGRVVQGLREGNNQLKTIPMRLDKLFWCFVKDVFFKYIFLICKDLLTQDSDIHTEPSFYRLRRTRTIFKAS